MRSVIHIWPEAVRLVDGRVRREARIERSGLSPFTVWYEGSEALLPFVAAQDDAFLLAGIYQGMTRGGAIHLHGTVSSGLLGNLDEFIAAWSDLKPDTYRRVDVMADEERSASPLPTGAISAFTGGVDSAFTLWRNARLPHRTTPITAALFVHGFDIPLTQPEVYARAAARVGHMTSSLGIPLFTVATNYRALEDDWRDTHGLGVTSALIQFGARHRQGRIPSTHAYAELRIPFGSNPLTDPLLSSERFHLRYDGATHRRTDKIAALAEWPEAMHHLRVCWAGPHLDRNCGACRKCVGTAICFAAMGLSLPPALPIPDLAAAIRALSGEPMNPYGMRRVADAVRIAREQGRIAPWIEAAETWIQRSTPIPATKPDAAPRPGWMARWRARRGGTA